MRRVEEDGDWSLMCPAECPGLADCWGPRFDELYESYERKGKTQHYTNHSHVHIYALSLTHPLYHIVLTICTTTFTTPHHTTTHHHRTTPHYTSAPPITTTPITLTPTTLQGKARSTIKARPPITFTTNNLYHPQPLYPHYPPGKARSTIKARELWYAILDAQMETGNPYMLYKGRGPTQHARILTYPDSANPILPTIHLTRP